MREMAKLRSICHAILLKLYKLKDPYLVSNFQNYFGVYRVDISRNGCDVRKGCEKSHSHENSNEHSIKRYELSTSNGSVLSRRTSRHIFENTNAINSDNEVLSDSETEASYMYRIENKFWYYLFSFGASLGYEMFYSSFFPFWFWNIDGAVGRRVVLVWVIIMYVGQALKDVIRWLRPSSPPVVHLEPKYVPEYGMPSTHAMVGAAVPFSLLIFTMHRYEYPFVIGLLLCLTWCLLVCCSRLYMGMHSILDIIGGLVLVSLLMLVVIPLVDFIDYFQLNYVYSPIIIISTLLAMAILYPASNKSSPSRGDTTIILGTGAGISLGAWLNFQLGIIRGPGLPPPYQILWPDYSVIGLALLRATIGILCIVATRAFFKTVSYAVVCHLLRLDPNSLETKQTKAVEISCKFTTYLTIGFIVTYISPIVFRFLNIERVTMFTEV